MHTTTNFNLLASPSKKGQIALKKQKQIQDVWKYNFEEEFMKITEIAEDFNFVSFDTEFPGVIYYPQSGNEYTKISQNVELLKVIQIGFTFSKEDGTLPENVSTFQFNFKFDPKFDKNADGSVKFLEEAGIDFSQLLRDGIDHKQFAEYFISSGLALNEDIKWITFHGGFDFAYLMKMLINREMPNTAKQFYSELQIYFPNVVDIKYLVKDLDKFKFGGLQKLANDLNIKRIGQQHQAGSDSLLTTNVYYKLKQLFKYVVNDPMNENVIYGLEDEFDCRKDTFNEYSNEHLLNEPFYANAYTQPSFIDEYNQQMLGNNMTDFNHMLSSFYTPQQQPYYYPNNINGGLYPHGQQYDQQ